MSPGPAVQPLEWNSVGHGSGLGSLAYASDSRLLTCGADGKAHLRDTASCAANTSFDGFALPCFSIVPNASGTLAILCTDKDVKVIKLPEMTLDCLAIRAVLPFRSTVWQPDGKLFAAGGDSSNIKLCVPQECQPKRQLLCEGYVRGMAWDPTSKFLAAIQTDGLLYIWDTSNAAPKQYKRLKVGKKRATTSLTPLSLSWHPDGGYCLAVPGADNDVVLVDQLSGDTTDYLTEGHSALVQAVAFCPNGLYLASGSEDGSVCIWDMGDNTHTVLARASGSGDAPAADGGAVPPPRGIISLAWHPSGNSLAVMSAGGQVAVWQDCVPGDLPGPAVPIAELVGAQSEQVAPESGRPGSAAVEGPAISGAAGGGRDEDDTLSDFIVQDGGERGRTTGQGGATGGRSGWAGASRPPLNHRLVGPPPAPRELPPQPPFQPCSTLGLEGKSRFLAYTRQGCVVATPVDDHQTVEVKIFDTQTLRAMGRIPLITDYYGFTLGALADKGLVLACPPRTEKDGTVLPSMVSFRPFDSWATNSDWQAFMPAGEVVRCVAVGARCVAAATSAHLLRIYSHTGVQIGVQTLGGPPIALAAQGHLLAAVTLAGPPSTATRAQSLQIVVLDISAGVCAFTCACPLTPAPAQPSSSALSTAPPTTLTWLGFTERGALAVADSTGCVYLRSPQWGGSWVPVWAAADHVRAGETYWPVAATSDKLYCIMLSAPHLHPVVVPMPYLTELALRVPMSTHEHGGTPDEAKLLLAQLSADQARVSLDEAAGGLVAGSQLEAADLAADRAGLVVFNALLKAKLVARALEVASSMTLSRSLEGAVRLANHSREGPLAERLALLLEQRQEADAAAAAAVEEATYGEGMLAGAGAYTPIPLKAVHAREERAAAERGVLREVSVNGAPVDTEDDVQIMGMTPPSAGLGSLTALKAAAAGAQQHAQQQQDNGHHKRKAGAPAAPLNNPFARRPVNKQAKA